MVLCFRSPVLDIALGGIGLFPVAFYKPAAPFPVRSSWLAQARIRASLVFLAKTCLPINEGGWLS